MPVLLFRNTIYSKFCIWTTTLKTNNFSQTPNKHMCNLEAEEPISWSLTQHQKLWWYRCYKQWTTTISPRKWWDCITKKQPGNSQKPSSNEENNLSSTLPIKSLQNPAETILAEVFMLCCTNLGLKKIIVATHWWSLHIKQPKPRC